MPLKKKLANGSERFNSRAPRDPSGDNRDSVLSDNKDLQSEIYDSISLCSGYNEMSVVGIRLIYWNDSGEGPGHIEKYFKNIYDFKIFVNDKWKYVRHIIVVLSPLNINEKINWKKGIAGAALGVSLALSTPNIAKGQEMVDKIENVTSKTKLPDVELGNILNDIKNNIKSTDSVKYQELFNRLSTHLSSKYGYQIVSGEVPKIDKSDNLTIFQILGWLGSICLAVCGLPQAWMSYKDKHSRGISWAFILLWAMGEAFALAYVYDKLDAPLVVNYITNILIVGVILYYKINPSDIDLADVKRSIETNELFGFGKKENKLTKTEFIDRVGKRIVDPLDFIASSTLLSDRLDHPKLHDYLERCEEVISRDGYITDYELIGIGIVSNFLENKLTKGSERISKIYDYILYNKIFPIYRFSLLD